MESSSSRKRANGGEEEDLNIPVVLKNRYGLMLSLALLLFNRCRLLLLLCVIQCVAFVRILADNSRLLSSSALKGHDATYEFQRR